MSNPNDPNESGYSHEPTEEQKVKAGSATADKRTDPAAAEEEADEAEEDSEG